MSTAGVMAGPAINHSNPTVLQQHPSGVLIIEDQAGHLHGVEIDAHGHPVRRHLTPEQEKKASTVVSILFGCMIIAQLSLVYWKKKHRKSYQQVTCVGLWIIPFFFASHGHFYKLLTCWVLWTAGSAYTIYKATRKPLPDKTPRLVYSYFFYLHKICYGLGSTGYFMIMADFFGIPNIFGLEVLFAYVGGIFLFFSLYFGILSRDAAEMCTDRMATSMGYGKKVKMPQRGYDPTVCLLCNDPLSNNWALMNSSIQSQHVNHASTAERTVELSCGHSFHDFCIRGWTIVGKKDTCPYCSEKVVLRSMFANPWDTQSLLWANIMDAVRYLVVWNPIIVGMTQFTLWEFGMDKI